MRQHLLEYIDSAKSGSVRGLRVLVEYFYALEIFEKVVKSDIHIISVFGSARIKSDHPEYARARDLSRKLYENGFGVVTGASFGIMGAANHGVSDGVLEKYKKKFPHLTDDQIKDHEEFKNELALYSLGLKITLPFEANNNPYLGTSATFHYFMVRKFFFAALSSAFVACEGGWGTRDELFEILTLVQTGKAPLMPIIYVTPDPEHIRQDVMYAHDNQYYTSFDLELLEIVSDADEAVLKIKQFYSLIKSISNDTHGRVEISLKRDLTEQEKSKIQDLVTGKYKDYFKEPTEFKDKRFDLCGFTYRSFGIVKDIINSITRP